MNTKVNEIGIEQFKLDCGMPLLVEKHATAKSVAIAWLLPVGSSADPSGAVGTSTCLDEWIWRGAGTLNSRQLSDALDRLGVERSSSVGTRHLSMHCTLVGHRLSEALPTIVSVIRRPRLCDDTFEPVRDLALQALAGLKDEHQHRVMMMVKKQHFPDPLNRSGMGEENDIRELNPALVRDHWFDRAKPGRAIMAIAGDVNGPQMAGQLNGLLADWNGSAHEIEPAGDPLRGVSHEQEETQQVHIALAQDAPTELHDDSVLQRIATAVMSGGMSGRLFTEVREKRSLCYSVHASYSAGRDFGAVLTYSGTTAQRAQETLDVILAEIERLRQGVTQEEFSRAVTGLKSSLVMHGESTSARASAMAGDQYTIGRPRTLDELKQRIEAVTLADVNAYLARQVSPQFTLVTLGPRALTMSSSAAVG